MARQPPERMETETGADGRPEPRTIPHWHSPDGGGFTFVEGEGPRIIEESGAAYLDFVSQLFNASAGYSEDRIIEAMFDQLKRLPYVAPKHQNPARTELAGRITEVAPQGLTDVLFSVTGSGAVELASHLARSHQDASTILSRYRGYHGSTYGAGSLTSSTITRMTLERYAETSGSARFLPPIAQGTPFDADSPERLAEEAADHVEWVIRNEGPDSVAAVITEVVAGTSGGYTAPPGYFERLREICDEYDCLLIFDEVITGFGRCGDWFACQTEDVEPDMLVFAKGVTGAYAPLAGVLMREEIADDVLESGLDIGQTWGGHPVSCAAGLGAMDAYADGLLDNVRDLAPILEGRLEEIRSNHEVVADIHGRGFLRAVEFRDPGTGEPFFDHRFETGEDPIYEMLGIAARDHQVLFGPGRPTFNLMMAPPFCIDERDVHEAMDALDATIAAYFG